ncbi:hypothetical protein ERO13_D07G184700v2 [Gossypium hirsutum]|uniref:Uncharacterized protein isoform X3 n=1 Tax=Gossypium hirsutum TaxID=3635 RepID=A0ABM3AFS5_GOSHI|nr:uncharacterized protein LOC107954833 isoform X3 [Gossypium hirsutum]KAG4139314.1 hypothetical protein ERO13_D07G184700v2 [Gossypium hirsutum]
MACLSLCLPEGEFDELLEHVPLSTRRKLLLSPTVPFENQVETSSCLGPLSLPPCSARDQVDQHLAKDSPNYKVTSGLPINVNSERHQADELTGTEANADASGLQINAGVFLPPNPVPSNVPGVIKVDCADKMLPSLSKEDANSSATTGVIASCQDVDLPINGNSQGSESDHLKGNQADASEQEKINFDVPLSSDVSTIEKVDCADNMLLSLSNEDTNNSASTGVTGVNMMDKKLSDFTFGELDHIVLKERRKLLLKRKFMELEKPAVKGIPVGLREDTIANSTRSIKQELQPIDGECLTSQNQFNDIPIRNAANLSGFSANNSSSLEDSAWRNKEKLQYVDGKSWLSGIEYNDIPNRSASNFQRTSSTGTESDRSGKRMGDSNIVCPSQRTSMEFTLRDGDDSVPASTNICSSALNTSVKLKVEPLDYSNLQNPERSTFGNMVSVKCEEDISDGIDHMLFRDRMKLLTPFEDFKLNFSNNFECLGQSEPAAFGFSLFVSEPAKPIMISRPRSRKKTATDSVVTALEEDAPELLKVLRDQGVSVDEIKLYGESENYDALDESFNEDSFSELEAVMTKLFSQRSHFLKFSSIRCAKGSKPSYCLACLFSLVEQTRYLQFRRWPVEWGWCRDLQSFIFVFKRHHRIVLERPEYGYATYFFELLDSLPVGWQVMRLVTAMKLTRCGRITLIENKPLSVGEDLSEGEAKVLMQYGWVPNTGLGTMLNYCDRVVHDRKNESDSSEWRSKIGKLLVDAYNGGTIVSASLVEDVIEQDSERTQIKTEL